MPDKPLLIPLASLIAGLCIADLLSASPAHWALPALLLTTLAACFVNSRITFLLSITMLFFVWGACSLEPFLAGGDGVAKYLTEQPVRVLGVIDSRPEGFSSGGGRITLKVERLYFEQGTVAVSGRLLVQIKEGRARLCTGDRILLSTKIREPRMLGLPGESDYPRRLAYQQVFATGFVNSAEDLVLVRAGEGWRHDIDRLAERLGRFISGAVPGVEGAVLKALLLGDKGDIPEELNDAYARSGVNHILSISGFHIGVVYLCIFHLLFFFARRCEGLALHLNLRRVLLVASLPVVLFYLFLSGAAAATVRSVLMIAAFIAALHVKRETDPVNTLMLAASLMLFSAPQTLFDLSFQLSFLAIWGLVVLAPPLAAPFQQRPVPIRWLALLLAASAAAIAATLVPVGYYFHRISFIGLVANLVVVPLMGYGAVVAGFAALPLTLLAPAPAEALLRGAAVLVRLADSIVLYLARTPVFTGYAPTRVDIFLACLALAALTFMTAGKFRAAMVSLLLVVLLVRAAPAGGGEGMLRVVFLSIGQGDAALVWLPDGKTMLVDGGGRAGDDHERVGARLLLPALASLGVSHIDFLVLSHEHPDHLQGVLYLARHFSIGELWESGVTSTDRDYLELQWLAAARGMSVQVLNGSTGAFTAGGATVEPLWPPSAAPSTGDANDTSLVMALRYGSSRVLFTGDLDARSERELVALGKPLQSTLLKVAHHGSKYSSSEEFLSAVSPRVAFISAGYANPFHLPAPSTVKRLQQHGIKVYRTDRDGSVVAECGPDGSVTVSTPWGHFN